MNDIIQEIATIITTEFENQVELLAGGGHDISTSVIGFSKALDQVGNMLVGKAMETLNKALVESPDRKRYWVVKNRADKKTLCTKFGEAKYTRTCFQNKKTGECCYLADELAGLAPHDRMDTSLKAELVVEAVESSYGRSGESVTESLEFSAQTVMNTIRELGPVENNDAGLPLELSERRSVPNIYIEADEDHVALQNGRNVEPKLVYVHEGRKQVGKDRWELVNARCFGGVYPKSEDLWLEVADYLERVYDLDAAEHIYLSGDGAPWIKSGVQWVRGSEFVLDGFHLLKYVRVATGHMKFMAGFMWEYINNGDLKNLQLLFEAILHGTEEESKRKAVYEARNYIYRHWDAVKKRQDSDYEGCSAEGHVSHILSARLSSRPLGWSVEGADQMARLRVFSKNGGNVYELMMERKQQVQAEERSERLDKQIQLKRNRSNYYMNVEELTVLGIGKRTNLFKALKSVRAI